MQDTLQQHFYHFINLHVSENYNIQIYTRNILVRFDFKHCFYCNRQAHQGARIAEEERNSVIKKSETKYRSIIDNSLEGIFQSTLDARDHSE
ncbi:MAG: hypothetical protein MZV64_18770 [Ignavibacteriales bacterium]|nr:hypothetical protein [Ignavibacteriales bacterium]